MATITMWDVQPVITHRIVRTTCGDPANEEPSVSYWGDFDTLEQAKTTVAALIEAQSRLAMNAVAGESPRD